MLFDPVKFSKVFVSFSGGKDSVASFVKVREVFPLHKIVLIFTDTGDELPETYEYLKYFDENVFPVLRLVQRHVATSESGRRTLDNTFLSWDVSVKDFPEMKIVTIFDEIMFRFKGNPNVPVWPTNGIRYCTKALKVNPFFKYIRFTVDKKERTSILIVKGLRREESKNRVNTPEYVVDEVNGDFYSVWHPVYNLTTQEVFDLHRENGIKINGVYDYRERSNCAGCPFARDKEILQTQRVHPGVFDPYIAIEELTGYSWKNGKKLSDVLRGEVSEVIHEEESCTSGYCDI